MNLAVDYAAPFIWALAVVVVAGVTWVLSTATKTGIGDIVEAKLKPVLKRLDKQDQMMESIGDSLADTERRADRENERIWKVIDELRGR